MLITLTLAAVTGIEGFTPNVSVPVDIPADVPATLQADRLAVAVDTAWTELKAGLRADRATLTVQD